MGAMHCPSTSDRHWRGISYSQLSAGRRLPASDKD
jgi:hypothetical protein